MVTARAKIGRGFDQERSGFERVMNGVTAQAIQLGVPMAFAQLGVAYGAAKLDLADGGAGKTEDFFDIAVSIDMFRSRTVTGLAPTFCGLRAGEQFLVPGGLQSFAGIIMARDASIGADIIPCSHRCRGRFVLVTGGRTFLRKSKNRHHQQKAPQLHIRRIGTPGRKLYWTCGTRDRRLLPKPTERTRS